MPDEQKEKEIEEALAKHLGYTIGDRFVIRFTEEEAKSHQIGLLRPSEGGPNARL